MEEDREEEEVGMVEDREVGMVEDREVVGSGGELRELSGQDDRVVGRARVVGVVEVVVRGACDG